MMRPSDTEYRYKRLDHHMEQVRHDLELLLQHEQISQADYYAAEKEVAALHKTIAAAHRIWEREHMSHRWFDDL